MYFRPIRLFNVGIPGFQEDHVRCCSLVKNVGNAITQVRHEVEVLNCKLEWLGLGIVKRKSVSAVLCSNCCLSEICQANNPVVSIAK